LIIKKGSSRLVLVLAHVVIKVPNPLYSWRHFITGLLANMTERDVYCWNTGNYDQGAGCLLCPVLWGSWGGWVLIMQRADIATHILECAEQDYDDEYESKRGDRYKPWIDAGFGGDDKPDNYGYLNGRLVKTDYGQ